MNKTIISIEVQENGGKEATIIVTGERNNQILVEESFEYNDENKHSLRLHFLIDKFLNNHGIAKGENMATPCISKLLSDIKFLSKMKVNPDYRVRSKDCSDSTYRKIGGILVVFFVIPFGVTYLIGLLAVLLSGKTKDKRMQEIYEEEQ